MRRKRFAVTCPNQVPVRRAGRARPARLAGLGVPRGVRLRRAHDLRPLRRRQRVLFRSARGARVPARHRIGARVVQRFVPGPVFPAEGGLSLRLQHAESGGAEQRIGRDRAQSRARRPFAASRCQTARALAECGARREQPRSHAPRLQGCAGDLRFLVGRAAGSAGGGDHAEQLLSGDRRPGEVGEAGRVNGRLLAPFSANSIGRDPRA